MILLVGFQDNEFIGLVAAVAQHTPSQHTFGAAFKIRIY